MSGARKLLQGFKWVRHSTSCTFSRFHRDGIVPTRPTGLRSTGRIHTYGQRCGQTELPPVGIEPAYRLRRFREPPQADFEVALLFVGCPRCERTLDQAIGNFGVVLGQALAPVRRPGLEALLEAGNPFVAERRRVLSSGE